MGKKQKGLWLSVVTVALVGLSIFVFGGNGGSEVSQQGFANPSLQVEEFRSGRWRIQVKDMPSLSGASVHIEPGWGSNLVRYRVPQDWCLHYGFSTASSTHIALADTCENMQGGQSRVLLIEDYRWPITFVEAFLDDDQGNRYHLQHP